MESGAGPQSPTPGEPHSPAPGPQSPGGSPPPEAPSGPQAPIGSPPAPEAPSGPQAPIGSPPSAPPGSPQAPLYKGPVPPGGWQQPPPQAGFQAQGALASWGSRLGAYLIDGLVLLVPGLILFFVIVAGAVGVSGSDNNDVAAGAVIGALILWVLLMAVVYLLYAPLLMARDGLRNGQTWGKQILNIRAVRNNGQPWNFGSAALREVVLKFLAVGIASSIIPVIPWFLNYFWPLWDDENRALHDMAASSHVVQA